LTDSVKDGNMRVEKSRWHGQPNQWDHPLVGSEQKWWEW